jgi:hypothetical protein
VGRAGGKHEIVVGKVDLVGTSIAVTRAMITRTFFCARRMARIGQATSAGDSAAVAT